MTADRPASELLAEFLSAKSTPEMWRADQLPWAWQRYEHALIRLARAEQALAEIEKLPDRWSSQRVPDPPMHDRTALISWLMSKLCEDDLRAALRASQGGQP